MTRTTTSVCLYGKSGVRLRRSAVPVVISSFLESPMFVSAGAFSYGTTTTRTDPAMPASAGRSEHRIGTYWQTPGRCSSTAQRLSREHDGRKRLRETLHTPTPDLAERYVKSFSHNQFGALP